MSVGPMSHPGNAPPTPNPCPACRGNGYVIEMWDRPGGPPGNQVMACERCNPPRRPLGPGIPQNMDEIWGNPTSGQNPQNRADTEKTDPLAFLASPEGRAQFDAWQAEKKAKFAAMKAAKQDVKQKTAKEATPAQHNLPPLHVECSACGGWGELDPDGTCNTCRECDGLGRIPTAAGRAILEFLEFEWPKQEDRP